MYETEKRKIREWINEIARHRLALPRFQRMEAWGDRDVEDLLQSVVDQLPIGSVLLLQVADKPQFSHRPLEGAPETGERVRELLLDGQQRLTALWRSLNDDYPGTQYFVKIHPDESTEPEDLPLVRRVSFYWRDGKKYPLWPSDPGKVHRRGLIPVSLLHPNAEERATEWTREVVEGDQLEYQSRLSKYREQVANYEIPYIALKPEAPPEAVITSFTKLNTQGTDLSAFDLVVAQMEAHDVDLHAMTRDLRSAVPHLRFFEKIDDLDLLRAVVLLDDRLPTQKRILRIEHEQLVSTWDGLIDGCRRALDFMQDEGVLDARRLPVKRIVPAMMALWTLAPDGGLREGDARRLLRAYLWQACFSDRYERGGMTPLLHDFRAIRRRLRGGDVAIPCFDEDDVELPTKKDLIHAGSPKKRNRLARSILCLSLRQGARDIHDERPATPESVQQREYHHLFPRAYLRDQGREEDPDRALNIALVTWQTNRSIAAKEPAKYLAEATQTEGGREAL